MGEIVLWAANDKRGYLIDINGSWAKIDGQRWLRENMAMLHNTYKKASTAYRYKLNVFLVRKEVNRIYKIFLNKYRKRKRFKKKEEKKSSNKMEAKEDSQLIKNPSGASSSSSIAMSSSSLQPVNVNSFRDATSKLANQMDVNETVAALECELSANTSSTNTLSESDFLVKYGHIDEIIPVKLSMQNEMTHVQNSVSERM